MGRLWRILFICLIAATPQKANDPVKESTKAVMSTQRSASSDETSPEIKAAKAELEARRAEATSRHFWLIVSLGLVAFAGFFVLATTLRLDWKNDSVREAEASVTSLEMAKIKVDADAKIADAKLATAAVQRDLQVQIGRNLELQRSLDAKIADAKLATAVVQRDLQAQIGRNLELQRSLLPRTIDETKVRSALEEFSGTRAVIETVNDFEARRTAELIRGVLLNAKWEAGQVVTRMDGNAIVDFFFPGIQIAPNCISLKQFERGMPEDRKSMERCVEITRKLHLIFRDGGLADARSGTVTPDVYTLYSVVIRVGLRSIAGEPKTSLIVSPNGGFMELQGPASANIGPDGTVTIKKQQ